MKKLLGICLVFGLMTLASCNKGGGATDKPADTTAATSMETTPAVTDSSAATQPADSSKPAEAAAPAAAPAGH